MTCATCRNTAAYAVKTWFENGVRQEWCDRCSVSGTIGNVPDVYFKDPGSHYNIYDEKGTPVHIGSKSEKAYWLKRMNLRESGDRVRGASKFDPIAHRHAMESLRRPNNETK